MIDWDELESPEEAPQAPKSDIQAQVDAPREAMSASAVEHWKRNLERFPVGHIGHEYAKQALANLPKFDKRDESEA